MQLAHMDYVLDDALDRFDFARCQGWLTRAYWSEGIGEGEVRLGFSNSTLVVGAYRDGVQVACLRLISDRVRFAYLWMCSWTSNTAGSGSLVRWCSSCSTIQP
ncbi:MAG TPA: hypothetical protein VER33_26025 [Polyangiaceae bacterium]|nr:hypothetical protein [Polyangiaceae bacterium]